MSEPGQIPCTICQQGGHRASKCPELTAPLRPGFFAPSGGGGHSHDDDDEKLQQRQQKKKQTLDKPKRILP